MSKPFKSVESQILLLKSRNLKFKDEEAAKKRLLTYGYYEIINGYKEPFLDQFISDSQNECYRDGSYFESIVSLYEFDKSLSYLILRNLLHIEVKLRTSIGYVIGKNIGHLEVTYIDRTKYRQGKKNKNKPGYRIDSLLKKFEKITKDNVEPYIHYREKYNNIPPWIMLKGTSFGNLIEFLKLQKVENKKEIIALFLGKDLNEIDTETIITTMEILLVFKSFRNKCAHNGRIYNYNPLNHKRNTVTISYNKKFFDCNGISEKEYKRKYKVQSNIYILICGVRWVDQELYESLITIFVFMLKRVSICEKWLLSEMGLSNDAFLKIKKKVRDLL
jgi:abortive infection bacteriophage resistance protein